MATSSRDVIIEEEPPYSTSDSDDEEDSLTGSSGEDCSSDVDELSSADSVGE